ncbi:MAG: hypothetical protein LBP26_04640 [Clostridiales bacterium]|jgi:cellobiose phosphorylase|nr:hypothetical protein [Clostridiales bacterium]
MKEYGYFDNAQGEYVITDYKTPRTWLNYMWNDRFFTSANHFGSGEGNYIGNAAKYNDPERRGHSFLINGGARYFYVKTENEIFSPGWFPVRNDLDAYNCRVGLNYSVIEGAKDGISAQIRMFVNDSDPAEIWTVRLKNTDGKARRVQFFSYVEFSLVGYYQYCGMQAYSLAKYLKKHNMVLALNRATEKPHPFYNGYICSDTVPSGFDCERKSFVGAFSDASMPDAVSAGKCNNKEADCESVFIGALQHDFYLKPGGEASFNLLIGSADSEEFAVKVKNSLFKDGEIERQFNALRKKNADMLSAVRIETPDERINGIYNVFLKKQVMLCIQAGRAWMQGFRDQLQDSWGAVSLDAPLARGKLTEVLEHIYSDGRCPRGFNPLDPHIYSDGPVWIAPAVNAYIKESGDATVLDDVIPYLDGGTDTVYGHIITATFHSAQDLGAHGLVKARDGDWNDSLNFLCRKEFGEKGESVWTSIALFYALNELAEIARRLKNDQKTADKCAEYAAALRSAVNEYGWDGEWFLAGYNDLGQKVGCSAEKEGKIYLNPQTWAVFSGITTPERAAQAMKSVDKRLKSRYGAFTLYPPYTALNQNIGRLTAFRPGIWENGTPYCHGGTFKTVADACLKRGDELLDTVSRIMPDHVQNPVRHSGCEPYVLTNMYYGDTNPKAGEVMFAWVTGTAGWMYRLFHEYVFGFKADYDGFSLDPCIPPEWKSCKLTRRFRGATYRVEIQNEGAGAVIKEIYLDGAPHKGNRFTLDGQKEHIIRVIIE